MSVIDGELQTGARSRLFAIADRIEAFVDMVLTKGGLQAIKHQRPLSLSAFALTSRIARLGFVPKTVLDVGANRGQFTAAVIFQWPSVEVHAFEPLPEDGERLQLQFGRLPNVHVYRHAVGDQDGSALLHRHAHSLSSSLLASTEAARERFEWAAEVADVEVQVHRLDSLFSTASLRGPVLLKIDVQGFESQVLAGAASLLSVIDVLLVEQAFEPFYEGQRPFHQAHADLVAAGWVLARVLSTRSEGGIPVEADCLYLPRESPLLANASARS